MILASLLIVVAAYLLGSLPSGYLLMLLFRHQDIRQTGSGNIGATNVLRSGGKGLAAATFLLDMLKGSCAVWLGGLIGALLAPGAAPDNMKALAA
ncbi:MAG: glycerol-3-phosphate acyltransferase, partial [Terracidiphilus sp.]